METPRRATLSIAIITLNEEINLPRTLASVSWADEIVVVDSGSTDATRSIAHSYGARFVTEPWRGFAAQKNYALSLCTSEWVLSLDADEVSPRSLQRRFRLRSRLRHRTLPMRCPDEISFSADGSVMAATIRMQSCACFCTARVHFGRRRCTRR